VIGDEFGARSDEREMLCGFLDWYRAVVIHKVEGLSDADATRIMTPSGVSPLGIIRHLAWVERLWFQWRLAGDDVSLWHGPDNSVTFALDPADTVTSVVAGYRAEVEQADRVVSTLGSLDQLSVHPHPLFGPVSARWVLVHLIEETARHAGHLDVMREQLDGSTGD
jgi:hypothetical protein